MICRYVDTHTIGHKMCGVYLLLNWNQIAKGMAAFHDNFFVDKMQQWQQQTEGNHKNLPDKGIKPWISGKAVWWITSQPQRQLNESVFYCFNVMHRNINKQSKIWRPHFLIEVVFPFTFQLAWKLYLAVSHIWRSRIHCKIMTKK